MKKIFMLNNSQGVIGLLLGLKSRITSTKPLLTMLFMLVLGGWNSDVFAAWSGSGKAVSGSGTTWYVYDNSDEKSKTSGGAFAVYFDELTLSGPGAQVQFQAKKASAGIFGDGSGNLVLRQYNGSWSDVWSNGLTTSYENYSTSSNLDYNSTKIQFYIPSGTLNKYYRNLKVTMAQYLENPMKDSKACTKLDCGTADYLANSTNNSFTIAWCNVPAMTYKLSGDDADLFSVSISNNAEAGKWNTATITVTCNHSNRAGGHSATLEMKDTYGNYSKTITLSATTNKGTPTIDCSQVSASGLTYGQKLSASTISGQNATYKNNSYAGTYTWTRSDRATHTALGCTDYSVTFTPTDTNLNSVNCTIQVPMTKVAQTITWNQATKYFIDENATLSASTTGHDASVYFTSGDETIATINGNTVVMHKAGDVVITAHADATCNYNAASTVSHTLQFRNRPTLQWNKTGENDHIYASDTLAHLAYASYGNNTFNLPFEYSVSPAGVLIPTAKKDSLIANPELTQEAECIVTASFAGNETYCAINGTHTYNIEPKITPLFKLNNEDLPESPMKRLDLKIGETANMTFVGTDESNNRFTYSTNTQYVSYTHNSIAHTGVITGTVAGDEEIQFSQTGTTTIFAHERKIHVYVTKHVVTLSSAMGAGTWKVDSIYDGTLYSVSSPTGCMDTAMSAISITAKSDTVLRYVDDHWKAVGAGKDTLIFAMPANNYWTGDTLKVAITVEKYTPVITWNMESSYPWGAVINNPVSSTSDVAYTISSSNEAAAKVVDGKIEVYNKTENVTFTLSQPANYKYNAATTNVTKTISIYQPQNHVPFTINNDNNRNFYKSKDGDVVWSDNGYKIGDGGVNNDEGYVIIAFTGIPSTLTFTKHLDEIAWQLPVGSKATVYESSDNSNWTEIWSDETRTDDVESGELDLQPNTRYLKFYYNGSIYCHYNNIHVTDKTGIDAPQTYSFRTGYMGNLPTKRTIDVDWFNIQNCQVTLNGADKDQFEVVTTAFNANLDQYATAGIRVNYKHDKKGTHTATLHIESADIPAKTADITLTGTTEKAIQTMIWRDDITPIAVGKSYEKAVYATSGLDVTLTSENENIISVEGTTITGVSEGTTRLFVSQAGDSKWEAKNETIYVQVTAKKVQHIIWKDRLGNIKREDGKTVTMTLTAISDEGQEISYELDNDARQFASVNGNTLTISGWGTGKITAHQTGTNGYVEVSKTMNVASRNPNAGCNPLVLSNKSGELNTIASKEYDIVGEPEYLTFSASCDLIAINGLYVDEFYGGKYHRVQYIKRTGDNAITNNERSFGPFTLHRDATKLKFYTKVGATLVRYYNSVNVTLAKYLELVDNDMDFSSVDFGQVVYQEFYVDFSNISGVLDVEMATASEQFEIVTETLGNECGDINHYARVQVRFTGRTMGTENNTIVISNRDQRLEVPVSATVVKASQVITWDDADPSNVNTTDNVVMTATATSGEAVTFKSSDNTIAEPYDKGDGTWGLTIKKGGNITIAAKQAGNDNYDAAPDVEHTYNISRVTPEITTAPTATGIDMLHTALSNSNLSGGAASVDGSFAWANPETNATYGTHAYQVVFTPENQDWYTTATCEVNVKVDKATQTITWNFDQLEMYCNADITFDATASPSGLTVDYTTSDDKIAYVDGDNKLRIIKGGEVTITAIQEGDGTYAAAEPVAKTLNIMREKPTVVTHPTATPMKIGKLRDNASLTGGRAELNGKMADGSFAWKNGEVEVENVAGSFPRTVIFTPANSNYYDTVEFVMNVTVEKYAPTIAFTTLHGSDITYGDPLSMSSFEDNDLTATDTEKVPNETVAGSFAWKAATEIVNAGTPTMAKAIFMPNNQDWYTPVEFNIPVQVAQAEPTLHATAEEIFVVQTLSESHITNEGTPGTCSWDPSLHAETAYYEDGTHTLPFVFVSSDPNYKGGNGTVSLTVYSGCVFVGGNEGGWQEQNNWVKETKPAAGDNVLIKNDVEISSAIEVNGLTIANGVDVVVESGASLTVGAGSSIPREHYGNVRVKNGGQMNLGTGELKINNFVLEAKLGDNTEANPASSGQVDGAEQLAVKGDAYFSISFDPRGAITYGWYDFTVPFEVNISGGIERVNSSADKVMVCGQDFLLMEDDEASFVNGGKGWRQISSGVLMPGKLYTITFDETVNQNTFRFAWNGQGELTNGDSFTAQYLTGSDASRNGWNAIGNAMLRHGYVAGDYKIQAYNHTDNVYEIIYDPKTFAVGTAFFIQVEEAGNIDWKAAEATQGRPIYAPQRVARNIDEFRISLRDEATDAVNDVLFFSASEEATEAYVIGHDLLKKGIPTEAKKAQMWATKRGKNLCDVEGYMMNNKASSDLNFFVPKAGSYELAIDAAPEDATLYLTYNGRAIWNLSMSAYEFDLEKGTTEGYGLRIVASEQTTTDIENGGLLNDENGVRKVMIDDVIYIVTPEGKMYDIVGKSIKF